MDSEANVNSIRRDWNEYRSILKNEPKLGILKAFRDNILCDAQFAEQFRKGPHEILSTHYPTLQERDIEIFIPHQLKENLREDVEPSDIAKLLQKTLDLDRRWRNFGKAQEPHHSGWKNWRKLQILRYRQEDRSLRAGQITHIPFAIELTEGCSGGCAFCGLSAGRLSGIGHDLSSSAESYKSLLAELHANTGELGLNGILYWATDPLDHPEYESYAALFAEEFGLWPGTTTALGELQIERVKSFVASPALERPWGLRLSMRSIWAFRKISEALSPQERAVLRLLPQYKESGAMQAVAGRAYSEEAIKRQDEVGGSIACMSGFLISWPRHEIRLITPCCAEPKNPNGYRSLAVKHVKHTNEFSIALEDLLKNLPCPAIKINQPLTVNIDSNQFMRYYSHSFPDLLHKINANPLSLADLTKEMGEPDKNKELLSYCLTLMQYGVLQTAKD